MSIEDYTMPKVMAYQCKHTGTLFRLDQKKDYEAHLARLRRERAAERKENARILSYQTWYEESIEQLDTIEKIRAWLLDDGALMRVLEYTCSQGGYKLNKHFKITDITIGITAYSDSCSNSHSAPKGFPTNFGRKVDRPLGYPGIVGRIRVDYESDYPSFTLGAALASIGIKTGSGGGGGGSISWGITIFLEDWPALKRKAELLKHSYEEILIIDRLKDKKNSVTLNNYMFHHLKH